MNKNVKRMFFVTALILLLVSISAVNAADASNDTSSTIQQDVVKEVNVEKISTNDNKIVDTNTKNIKKETTTTDLYVSDTDGSDDNSGTSTSPYKTVQKALDQTNADSTFNIHIAEGTYKGLGNTNLTVNGNYNINIIGEGNAIIDGEAKYDLKKELDSGEYYWDSSPEWYPFLNGSGNYAINITTGNGQITLINITIQNCWSPGESSIDSYPTATVDNYANLLVDNVKFIDNCAGVGAGIRNNHDATLSVTNSLFDGNRKSSSTGNEGSGIYNNGTAIISNSTFQNNYARWGTILNDGQLTISNSIIQDNIAYDGSSTYKYGAGIATDSSKADFYNIYITDTIQTIIDNCTFINNGQTDVWSGNSNLIINNSLFKNSTGIYLDNNNTDTTTIIQNNKILDSIESKLSTSLSSTKGRMFGIYSLSSNPTVIQNNTINSQKKGLSIYVTSNTNITENNINNIYINNMNNSVKNNTIISSEDYSVNFGSNANNNTIVDNYIEGSMLLGNKAVESKTGNLIENNTPTEGATVTITDETYNNYFDENSKIIEGGIEQGSTVILSGDFYNKTFIITKKINIQTSNCILYNSTLIVNDTGRITATGLTFINNDTEDYVILLNTTKNSILRSDITVNTTCPIHTITILQDENKIQKSTITTCGPSNEIIGDNGVSDNIAIYMTSSSNICNENKIYSYVTSKSSPTGVIEAITIHSDNYTTTNNTINSNNVYIYGDNYAYGIYIKNSNNNVVRSLRTESINVYSNSNAVAVKLSGNVSENWIGVRHNLNAPDECNGVIIDGGENVNNNNISGFRIGVHSSSENIHGITIINANNTYINAYSPLSTSTKLVGNNITGISLINANNTIVRNVALNLACMDNAKNNITGILLINSNNTKINGSINISDGNILNFINSNDNTFGIGLQTVSNIGGSLGVLNNSNNNLINSTQITSSSNQPLLYLDNSNNNTVINNMFNSNQTICGNDAVIILSGINNVIENNTPTRILLTDTNYNNYFTNSELNDNSTNTIIIIDSDIYNKNFTFKQQTNIYNPNNYTIYNGSMNFTGNAIRSSISGLNFNSTDNRTTIIYSDTRYLSIINTTIYHDTNSNITRTIFGQSGDAITTFQNNNLNIIGREVETDDNLPSIIAYYNNNPYIETISNNNFNITYNYSDKKGTIAAIYKPAQLITIQNTNISIIAENNAIASLGYVILENNNLNIKSNNNTTGLIRTNNSFSEATIRNNNITITSPNIHAVYDNIARFNLQNNNIELIGENITAVYLENLASTYINSNTIKVHTNTSNKIIILNNSPISIENNNIITTTNNNENPIIEIINPAVNSYVKNNYIESFDLVGNNAVRNSDNVIIENNTPNETGYKSQITDVNIPENIINKLNNPITITTTDIFGQEINGTITITDGQTTSTSDNNTINYTPQSTGEKTLTITYTDPTGKYNTTSTIVDVEVISPTLTVDPITVTAGQTINITARITADDETITDINKGKVTFKVNGKTLKDANGKVIYAKVVNGTATIENYEVPNDWAKEGTTIQAVYSGSTECEKLTSEKTNITVTPEETTLTITPLDSVTPGQTTTLTATLSDNTINTGKIVFKINGKTVKDANGKVIYAKVVNGTVSVDYTLPESYKAGNYTVTATFIASGYDRLEASETLTVSA